MNSFVKFLLIAIGIVVLGVAGCTALTIGGCATAIGVAALQTSKLPEYANAGALTKRYGTDLEFIHQSLEDGVSLKYSEKKIELNEDILAIIVEVNGSDLDIYKKYDAQLNGHITLNRAGTGSLLLDGNSSDCLIFLIEANDADYFVCIKDSFKTQTNGTNL